MRAAEFDETTLFRPIQDSGDVIAPMTSGDLTRIADRELSLEEARAYLDAPIDDHERNEILAPVRWFTTHYPSPSDRLAYVRRAYARWRRTIGLASKDE